MSEDPKLRQAYLQSLPSVEELLQSDEVKALRDSAPRAALLAAIRGAMAGIRETILHADEKNLAGIPTDRRVWTQRIRHEAERLLAPSLRPVINATGVIVHTNLGRSLLAPEALGAVAEAASRYSNLEFDLEAGERGSRYIHVEGLLCRLTGAEAATVVNNNAGAVLLSLSALARGKEVIVSRGELVEIGGSFRMPDVMAESGALLVEVGTTNKTHPRDYEAAIGPETALLLKVHTSNYRILGFTQEVPLDTLVRIGRGRDVPVMDDLGSGCLVDLREWGLEPEPMVQEALAAGADLVTFSGDKLLGGPQAGLILGRRELVERIRRHPFNRALRIDKLTLAALEATLRLYWDPNEARRRIPTLRMIAMGREDLRPRAQRLARRLRKTLPSSVRLSVRPDRSQVGGGALPLLELPTWVLGIQAEGISTARLERALRRGDPPVIARVEREELVLDLRTIQDEELPALSRAVAGAISKLLEADRGAQTG